MSDLDWGAVKGRELKQMDCRCRSPGDGSYVGMPYAVKTGSDDQSLALLPEAGRSAAESGRTSVHLSRPQMR